MKATWENAEAGDTIGKEKIRDIQIPDLYKIAQIPELGDYILGDRSAKELVLECWHLTHILRRQKLDLLAACKAALECQLDGLDENTVDVLEAAIAKATD